MAQVFQSEASEILDSSDAILRQLRGEPDSVELLNDLRREMHTLKGSSRMAGFMTVGDLAHAAESVLDALGKGSAAKPRRPSWTPSSVPWTACIACCGVAASQRQTCKT